MELYLLHLIRYSKVLDRYLFYQKWYLNSFPREFVIHIRKVSSGWGRKSRLNEAGEPCSFIDIDPSNFKSNKSQFTSSIMLSRHSADIPGTDISNTLSQIVQTNSWPSRSVLTAYCIYFSMLTRNKDKAYIRFIVFARRYSCTVCILPRFDLRTPPSHPSKAILC